MPETSAAVKFFLRLVTCRHGKQRTDEPFELISPSMQRFAQRGPPLQTNHGRCLPMAERDGYSSVAEGCASKTALVSGQVNDAILNAVR